MLGDAKNYTGKITEALAPGMKYKHYSPRVPCYLVKKADVASAYRGLSEKGLRVALILQDETAMAFRGTADVISLGNTPKEVQHYVYAALREAERYDAAIIEDLSDECGYFAAMDRIKKATGGSTL